MLGIDGNKELGRGLVACGHGAPRFLYFPDENHWILTPGNARIWYETIFAFLAEHVLDQPWERPALL